jgi:hypothetical protein
MPHLAVMFKRSQQSLPSHCQQLALFNFVSTADNRNKNDTVTQIE